MNPEDLTDHPNALAALAALRRAAESARQTAIQTNTGIVIQRDSQLIRISADELRKAGATKSGT